MQLKLTLLRGSCTSLWLANVKSECCSKLRLPLNLTCVFQFWILFVPVWFQGKMRILQVGTSRGLQSFPLLLVFGCYFTQKVSHVFSAPQMTFFFFFLTVFLKTLIHSFYLFTFPLLFFDDEHKQTCQVGHKNDMKCISKSLIILCILL